MTNITPKFSGIYINTNDKVVAVAPYDASERTVPEPEDPYKMAAVLRDDEMRVDHNIFETPFSRDIMALTSLTNPDDIKRRLAASLTSLVSSTQRLQNRQIKTGIEQLIKNLGRNEVELRPNAENAALNGFIIHVNA